MEDYPERVWFQDPIQCPECGLHTHELIQGTSMDDVRGKVMMCDTCFDDTDEGLEEWEDGNWKI